MFQKIRDDALWERLSGLDASFLYPEKPAQMMPVYGSVVLAADTLPGGYRFDWFTSERHSGSASAAAPPTTKSSRSPGEGPR